MGWHSTVHITRDAAKALFIKTYQGTHINLNREIPDSVLEEFLDAVLYDSGYNAYVVDDASAGEEWRNGDYILEYDRVLEKAKELSWKAVQVNEIHHSLDDSALEEAARKLFNIGAHHNWFGPYVTDFDKLDPIGREEFLAIVAEVIDTYNNS